MWATTQIAFLHTTTGLTALESPWSPHERPHTRKSFFRDPAGTLLMQVIADLTRDPEMLGLGEIEDVEHQRHYFLLDGVGSVIGLADEEGDIVASWTYDPFGEVIEEYGDTHLTPYRFTSAYQDPTGLLKMGERYYDPALGRFTQQDPVWNPLDPKAWNRYVYVGNDPINFVDPTGLSPCAERMSRAITDFFTPFRIAWTIGGMLLARPVAAGLALGFGLSGLGLVAAMAVATVAWQVVGAVIQSHATPRQTDPRC